MYVSPYLSWVMDEGGLSAVQLNELCEAVRRYTWNVGTVGWDLAHIEELAQRVARSDPELLGMGEGAGDASPPAAAGAAAAVLLSAATASSAAASTAAGSTAGTSAPAAAASTGASPRPPPDDVPSLSDEANLLSAGGAGTASSSTLSSGRDSWASSHTSALSGSVDSGALEARARVAVEGVLRRS